MSSLASNEMLPTKRVSDSGFLASPYVWARALARSFGAALSRGVEKSTLASRPSMRAPFLALRAAAALAELENSTYPKPLERPDSRSEMTRAPVISPNSSNSRYNHSSSMFQLKLPTNRFLDPVSSTSVLDFLAAVSSSSSSALRFLDGAASSVLSSSESSESSESSSSSLSEELESEPDSYTTISSSLFQFQL